MLLHCCVGLLIIDSVSAQLLLLYSLGFKPEILESYFIKSVASIVWVRLCQSEILTEHGKTQGKQNQLLLTLNVCCGQAYGCWQVANNGVPTAFWSILLLILVLEVAVVFDGIFPAALPLGCAESQQQPFGTIYSSSPLNSCAV